MGRDYEREILRALQMQPMDGLAIIAYLHIRTDKIYRLIRGLEKDGLIQWSNVNSPEWVWEITPKGVEYAKD